MNKIKKFFNITEAYRFDWSDLSAMLTVANVVCIIAGLWWAPIIGIVNCAINIGLSIINRGYINGYVLNSALIVLNIFFLSK